MQKLFKNKKASTSVVVAIIIVSLSTGAIVTGTLLARRNANFISYNQAIAIAEAIPEVADFILDNDISSVIANRNNEIWVVEFFASDLNYSADIYYWMNYAYVEIDAISGEVLYYEINDPSNPNYTESEVIDIALAIPEISEWLETVDLTEVYAWYDGYDNWCIDIYVNREYANAHVVISDTDGSIIFCEIYDPLSEAVHTEAEILAIVEALPEVQAWKAENPVYDYSIHLSGIFITNGSEEIAFLNETDYLWIVEYWTVGEYNTTEFDWIHIVVRDSNGEVVDINERIDPLLSESEALQIAASIPEVSDFLENITTYNHTWFNDYSGIWQVYFENVENYHEYAAIEIDDSTGEVLDYWVNDLPDPTMNQSDVIALAFAQQEVQDFITENPEYITYSGFYDGIWFVDVIIADNRTIPEDGIIGINVLIDDASGLVTEINYIEVQVCD